MASNGLKPAAVYLYKLLLTLFIISCLPHYSGIALAETNAPAGTNHYAFRNLLAELNAQAAGTNEAPKGWFCLAAAPDRRIAVLSRNLEKKFRLDGQTLTFLARLKAPQGATLTITLATGTWDPVYKGTSWNKQKVVVPPGAGYQEVRALFDYTQAKDCYTRDVAITVDQGEIELTALDDLVLMEGSPEAPLPPSSSVEALNGRSRNADYLILKWDQTGGTYPARTYTIQYRDEAETDQWRNLEDLVGTSKRAGFFFGKPEHRYRFRSLAKDLQGNAESQTEEDEIVKIETSTPAELPAGFGFTLWPLDYDNGTYRDRRWSPFCVSQEFPTELNFGYRCGEKAKDKEIEAVQAAKAALLLEVPAGIEVLQCYHVPGFNALGKDTPVYEAGQVSKAGKPYTVYCIQFTPYEAERGAYFTYRHQLRVYFKPKPGFKSPDVLYYYPVVNGLAGNAAELPIYLLPALPSQKPADYFSYWIRFTPEWFTVDISAGKFSYAWQNDLFAIYKNLNIRVFPPTDVNTPRAQWLKKEGFKQYVETDPTAQFSYHNKPTPATAEKYFGEAGKEIEIMFNTDADGKHAYDQPQRWQTYFCPSYLMRRDTWSYRQMVESSREQSAKFDPDYATIDLEIGIGDAPVCFCPRCLEAFARRSGKPVTGLSGKEILKQYKDDWLAFKVWQYGEIIETIVSSMKAASPTLKYFPMINFFNVDNYYGKYGMDRVDVSQLKTPDGIIDEVTRKWDTLRRHFNNDVSKLKIPFILLLNPCATIECQSADEARMAIMETVCSQSVGFVLDRFDRMTPEHLYMVSRCNQEIDRLKDYFQDGKRTDEFAKIAEELPEAVGEVEAIDGQKARVEFRLLGYEGYLPSLYTRARTLAGKHLIDIFNYDTFTASRVQGQLYGQMGGLGGWYWGGGFPNFKRAGLWNDAYVRIVMPGIPDGKYWVREPVSDTLLVPSSQSAPFWEGRELRENGVVVFVPAGDLAFIEVLPGTNKLTRSGQKQITQDAMMAHYQERRTHGLLGRNVLPLGFKLAQGQTEIEREIEVKPDTDYLLAWTTRSAAEETNVAQIFWDNARVGANYIIKNTTQHFIVTHNPKGKEKVKVKLNFERATDRAEISQVYAIEAADWSGGQSQSGYPENLWNWRFKKMDAWLSGKYPY